MLTFFRRIRKGLLEGGRTSKYLLYAIGEIALVVIGILIALQINNWNEWRKDRSKESEVLEEVAQNIESNIAAMERYIQGASQYDRYSDYVISVLEGQIPYSDSVDNILNLAKQRRSDFNFSEVGYETLVNTGIDLVQNDSLKTEIVTLFEEAYPRMMSSFNWGQTDLEEQYFDQNFLPVSGGVRSLIWKPFDFDVQMNDPYFLTIIHKIKIQRKFYAFKIQRPLRESQKVLRLIKNEFEESEQ